MACLHPSCAVLSQARIILGERSRRRNQEQSVFDDCGEDDDKREAGVESWATFEQLCCDIEYMLVLMCEKLYKSTAF